MRSFFVPAGGQADRSEPLFPMLINSARGPNVRDIAGSTSWSILSSSNPGQTLANPLSQAFPGPPSPLARSLGLV